MDSHSLKARLAELGAMVEARLQGFADASEAPRRLKEAMAYSLMAGGKRLRPVLLMSAASLFGTPADKVLPFACAVEMVHTYSLIHDDLPAMDDDDLRRGRPSCHKAFGEATAILAGDALQADAFRTMTLCDLPADRVLAAVREFACAAGSFGMCGGQQLDMEAEEQAISLEELRHLHALKTGAILRAAVVCGCLLAGAPERDVEAFGRFGASLGVAFQIADDILDVVGDTATLGKPAGSDAEAHKSTYPSLVGLEESRRLARGHADEAIAAIQAYEGQDADFLRGLANFTVTRVK